MKPDGSLDAPFTLEDDDPPNYVPGPTVRRRIRQTLDHDGIEEISEAQQAQTAWKQAAARNRTKQRNGRNRSNDTSERDSEAKDDKLINKVPGRISSAKSVDIVGLSIDEDEPPTSEQITQRDASAEIKQPSVCALQAPTPLAYTLHEAVLPQRAKQPAPTEHISVEFSLFLKSSATPPYRSPYLPLSSPAPVPGSSVKLSEDTQLNRSRSVVPAPSGEPSVNAHAMLQHNTCHSEPAYTTTSALASSVYPTASVSSHMVPPPMQPVRDVADDHRGRTTSSRVNTAFEGGNARSDGDDHNMAIPVPKKPPGSSTSAIPRIPQKLKAIKSVRRRNDGIPRSNLSVRPPQHFRADQHDLSNILPTNVIPERLDVGSSNTRPVSPLITRRSESKDPMVDTSIIADTQPVQIANESIQTVRPGERNTTLKQPTPLPHEEEGDVVPERAVGTAPPLSRTATPTAQLSAPALVEQTQHLKAALIAPETTTAGISASTVFDRIQMNNAQPEHIGVPIDYSRDQASKVLPLQPDELVTTRSAIEECLKRHVAEQHESHAYLVWSKMWPQRTFQERGLRARFRKQRHSLQMTLPEKYIQKTSPFENMPAIQVPFDRSTGTKRLIDMSQEIFVKAKSKETVIKSSLAAPTTKYKSNAPMIPPFKEYVSLRNNILSDNESKLLATPYFQDEDYRGREVLLDTLPYIYEMTHDEKGPLDFRKEQCRFFKDAIEAFLSEVGVTWNDVLYWLLAPERDITRINNALPGSRQFEAPLLERSRYDIEEFERDGESKTNRLFNRNDKKWRRFLPQLKEPSASTLRLAATACAAVFQECEFSIWYLAQQSEVVQSHVAKKTAHGQSAKQSTYRETTCRVCHQHDCLLHGEIRQVPEDSWKTESEDEENATQATDESSRRGPDNKTPRRISTYGEDETDDEHEAEGPLPAHFDDDSDIEKVINYKLPANADAFDPCPEAEMIAPKGAIPPPGRFNSNWWLQQDMTQHWEKRKPFFPCKHEGSCESAKCRCYREGINCERTCKCSQSCNRRYPGCSCAITPGKRVCLTTSCLCVKFNRECDADLCGSCGASEVLDPVNRHNDDVVQHNCGNVAIQRRVPRKTLLGHSEVHGFGLYMGEDIKSGEYIGEYTGEAISIKEGDRRVTIYDYQKTMYLFRLNSKQEVDATYMGNKLRFINNADDKYTNCSPKNLLCNTVFRIALFATRDIKAGTELFFNYNYPKEKTEKFKQPNGKVVAVKQTKQKTKKRESLISLSQPIKDRSRVLAATAKAREAKAAKRAAAMLQQGVVETATRRRSGTLQARKAATSKPGRKWVGVPKRSGLNRNESTGSDTGVDVEASEPEMPPVVESQSTQASLYIQDTDEEDDEFVLPDTQEDEEVAGPVSDDEDSVVTEPGRSTRSHRGPGRPRKGESDVPPVVVVKQKKSKMGGARPGAGRKRKRPVIVNSDDE